MKARILPPEEWHRLDTGMPQIAPILDPERVRVVVVEDGDEIVAAVTLYEALHWEGTWVANKNATRALLRLATEAGSDLGYAWTYVSCDNAEIAALIERLNGAKIPTDHYVMPLPLLSG